MSFRAVADARRERRGTCFLLQCRRFFAFVTAPRTKLFSPLVARRNQIRGELPVELYARNIERSAVAEQRSLQIVVHIDFDVKFLIAVFKPFCTRLRLPKKSGENWNATGPS